VSDTRAIPARERIETRGYSEDKDAVLKRLRRIEGQVRGVERMVEEGALLHRPRHPGDRDPASCATARRGGYSYCSASSTSSLEARRAGRIAASTPANPARISNTIKDPIG
jgi:metal-sensitive transcriptional repressor